MKECIKCRATIHESGTFCSNCVANEYKQKNSNHVTNFKFINNFNNFFVYGGLV